MEEAAIVKKILPHLAVKLVGSENYGDITPIATIGINDVFGRGNIRGLGKMKAKDGSV